jgi:hypothetical protein
MQISIGFSRQDEFIVRAHGTAVSAFVQGLDGKDKAESYEQSHYKLSCREIIGVSNSQTQDRWYPCPGHSADPDRGCHNREQRLHFPSEPALLLLLPR